MTPDREDGLRMRGARILVVDDDEQGARVLERTLTADGHDCVIAHDAPAARNELKRGAFELLMLDIRLPGESGLELALDLLEAGTATAVVMVTGVDDPRVASLALERGVFG